MNNKMVADQTLDQFVDIIKSLSETEKDKLLWFAKGMNAVDNNKTA